MCVCRQKKFQNILNHPVTVKTTELSLIVYRANLNIIQSVFDSQFYYKTIQGGQKAMLVILMATHFIIKFSLVNLY